jgi:hypothetical protein
MALEQKSKFVLHLKLAESYIYGTAITSENSYSINIQQASNNLVVLPSDFFNIKESNEALVSFGLPGSNNKTEMSMTSEVYGGARRVGRGDLIEVYVNQDNVLLTLANNLPIEMTMHITKVI